MNLTQVSSAATIQLTKFCSLFAIDLSKISSSGLTPQKSVFQSPLAWQKSNVQFSKIVQTSGHYAQYGQILSHRRFIINIVREPKTNECRIYYWIKQLTVECSSCLFVFYFGNQSLSHGGSKVWLGFCSNLCLYIYHVIYMYFIYIKYV